MRPHINQTFPHKVCINLDRRPDRWQRMLAEFGRRGIESVRRFSARDGEALVLPASWKHTAGAYGCLRSHLDVVQQARDSGVASVLIFEDDAVFDPEFQTKFAHFMQEVPDDWDMLHFGALHKDEPRQVNDHVYRITKANSTYAYALKRTIFDDFINLNQRAEHVLDMNAYSLQEWFNCYCFLPNLAWVQTEYSDVQNRLERHWYLEQSLVLFGPRVDQLLSETAIVIAQRGRENENVAFLRCYYDEYFGQLCQIVSWISEAKKNRFFILADDDLYIEALDIRANLLMCEQYDGATGFSEIVELTPQQARLLRQTGITRGINISKNLVSKNSPTQARFVRSDALNREAVRLFQSPNHALRLPRS